MIIPSALMTLSDVLRGGGVLVYTHLGLKKYPITLPLLIEFWGELTLKPQHTPVSTFKLFSTVESSTLIDSQIVYKYLKKLILCPQYMGIDKNRKPKPNICEIAKEK